MEDLVLFQRKEESTKAFWDRYQLEAYKVLDPDEKCAVNIFPRGCSPGSDLVFKSYERPIHTLKECKARIEAEVRALQYLNRCEAEIMDVVSDSSLYLSSEENWNFNQDEKSSSSSRDEGSQHEKEILLKRKEDDSPIDLPSPKRHAGELFQDSQGFDGYSYDQY